MPYSLSLKKQGNDSKLIAKITGGRNKDSYVYLVNRNAEKNLTKEFDYDALEEKMKLMKIKSRDKVRLFNEIALLYDKKVDAKNFFSPDEKLTELYKFCCNIDNDESSLKLPIGSHFEVMPSDDPKRTGRYYICGMSESGKSWVSRMIIENYNTLFPQRSIYVVSKLKEDETLDQSKKLFTRINYETFTEEPPTIEEFSDSGDGSLILFDDYDNIKGKIGTILQTFIDDCCQMGRHENITTMMSTHFLTNYKLSSIKLAESNYFVVFPRNTPNKKLSYLLETYASLEAEQVKKVKEMGKNSRWVLVSRVYPKYCISECEIKILEEEN